jgi:RES domain-containing protein
LWLAPVVALTAACSSQPEEEPVQLTFHEIMKDKVDKNADELWDISNAAIGDAAGLDPAKMTDERWAQIAAKADAVQQAALEIATMDPIVVVRPGVKISDEGTPFGHTGAMVQARMDKDPETMRNLANALARHMSDLGTAARAHDAATAGPLIDQLDGVCEDCHLEYWYPDQKELVNQFRAQNK